MKQLILATIFCFATILTTFAQDKYLDEGNKFLNSGNFVKAEKTFRAGIKSDSTNLIYECQLGFSLIEQKKYSEAGIVLDKVLKMDSVNVGALWYGGINNFESGQDKKAIPYFEKALTLFDKTSGQYYSANWFIGKCFSNLLATEGLSYQETDRMFECYEEYLRLQPNATDAAQIREYVDRKKKRRPTSNVLKWVDL